MLQTYADLFVLFYDDTFLFLVLLLFLNLVLYTILLLFLNIAAIYTHVQSLYVIFFLQFSYRCCFELTRYVRICSFNDA